jgi:hypothetical protein
VDQQQQDRVITNRKAVFAGRGRREKLIDLFDSRRSRYIFEIIEPGQFDARRKLGAAPALVGRKPKEAAQAAAQLAQ